MFYIRNTNINKVAMNFAEHGGLLNEHKCIM